MLRGGAKSLRDPDLRTPDEKKGIKNKTEIIFN